jgi:hypothetical protein
MEGKRHADTRLVDRVATLPSPFDDAFAHSRSRATTGLAFATTGIGNRLISCHADALVVLSTAVSELSHERHAAGDLRRAHRDAVTLARACAVIGIVSPRPRLADGDEA